MILPSGTMLGRYRIEDVLGQGQTGVVYLAFDTSIERSVAIKCLKTNTPDGNWTSPRSPIEVLFDEAKVIGQLNHSHVTAIFDMGTSDGVPYIVMEYVKGETLKSRLAQTRADPASVPQILGFIVMVARALHYVHQRGILHGDINPANLLVTPSGSPKVMDFGVARRRLAQGPAKWWVIGEEFVWGTAGYFAPELLVGVEIDARADVFSLGVVAYEWLTGRKPFWGETNLTAQKALLEGRLISLSEVGDFDPELSKDIDQALARDPAKRFASADAMADALELCQERLLKQEVSGSLSSGAGVGQPGRFPQLNEGNRLFADFSGEDLALVMQMSRRESYQAGETIVKEGAGGSTMYLVVRGRVSVRKMSGPDEIEIQQISSGECFGEMAVISQMPRSATVVALRSTEVIAISGAVLRTAGQVQCMKLYRNIASLLVERVRHRDEEVINLSRIDQQKRAPKRLFPFW